MPFLKQPNRPIYPLGTERVTSLFPGLYLLVGWVYERSGSVTDAFVKSLVWKGGMRKTTSKVGTLHHAFQTKCRVEGSDGDIVGRCNAIKGRQGSWVAYGPMDEEGLETSGWRT